MKKYILFFFFLCSVFFLYGEKYLVEVPLPQPDGTILGDFVAEEGKIYRFTLYVFDIPANVHGWKAKLKFELLNKDTGQSIVFEGSPKKYLYRKTDGNGRFYYTYLTFYVLRPNKTSTYALKLLSSKISLPTTAKAMFLVVERNPYKWMNMILIVLGVVILLVLFFIYRKKQEEYDDYDEDEY